MKKIFVLLLAAVVMAACSSTKKNGETDKSSEPVSQNFHTFKAENMQGNEVKMSDFDGKVVLVVNTASKCGYTPQFEGLEELYKKLNKEGLVVLGFPSNEFGSQDPGTNEEILEFCQANYGVTFPMFSKIMVNGEEAHPIYKYLKTNVPDMEPAEIKWNFTKFLIGKDGKPLKRYESKVKPAEIEADILKALAAK